MDLTLAQWLVERAKKEGQFERMKEFFQTQPEETVVNWVLNNLHNWGMFYALEATKEVVQINLDEQAARKLFEDLKSELAA